MIQVRRVAPNSRLVLRVFVALLILQTVSCSPNQGGPQPTPTPTPLSGPTGAQATTAQEDGQWPMPAKDYASTRYSGLDEINAGNVQNLKVAWTFSVGVNRGQEAAPIVVGDTMYVATPYPNILYALDLTKEKQGSVKWSFDPKAAAAAQGVACCDYVNRGAVFADGKVVYNTLDGQTIAVEAASGREVWRARLGEINKGESITMAPLVVKDKVLVRPERNGYVYVLDRATGEVLSAKPFVDVNSSTGVDLKTGALQYNKEKEPKMGQVVREICPAAPGAKDWQPSSFSPRPAARTT